MSLTGEGLLCDLGDCGSRGLMDWRLKGRLCPGSPASSESPEHANVNTSEEVFSIKVSNIWLHKHDTGCKNKAKKLVLITSIRAV